LKKKKEKILVTGNAGFIGSNLTEELYKEGHELVGIDNDIKKRNNLNFLIPEDVKVRYGNVNYVDRNFSMIWDDINSIERYLHCLDNIDTIYHLAASADIRKSYKEPTMDLYNNVNGTNAILELMRKKDIKNLIFSSSSAVYGLTKTIPTPEEVLDMRPISMYGASKLANEAFIHAYCDLYGLNAWVFRFANVVGKNEGRGVIYDLFYKLNKNQKELEILGDGNQEKSFFDVLDCVHGLIGIPRADNCKSVEIYNLGNKETMKVKKLAEVVCSEIGVTPKFTFTGGDRGWPGDAPYTILSIEKALNAGWKLKYDCEEAIRRTVKYLFERK
jgi:UDP-glucose 4-epimerase